MYQAQWEMDSTLENLLHKHLQRAGDNGNFPQTAHHWLHTGLFQAEGQWSSELSLPQTLRLSDSTVRRPDANLPLGQDLFVPGSESAEEIQQEQGHGASRLSNRPTRRKPQELMPCSPQNTTAHQPAPGTCPGMAKDMWLVQPPGHSRNQ